MICGFAISDIIRFEAFHFGLSAAVGWLAYWLMLTILSHSGLRDLLHGRLISLLPLYAALSCAVLAHIVEDYTINIF